MLDETRFLAPLELAESSPLSQGSLKGQVASFLAATRYLRIPLIGLNAVAIFLELLFG